LIKRENRITAKKRGKAKSRSVIVTAMESAFGALRANGQHERKQDFNPFPDGFTGFSTRFGEIPSGWQLQFSVR
jgi:hypothetical protein